MSQFTSHPYHTMPAIRPSRNNHSFPLSPPETEQESLPAQLPPASLVAGAELEQLAHSALGFPERSKFQSRRTSTLSYQNSGVRDNRDRTPSRGSKSLIVVLPPPDFPVDHGQLGNVLSMGPRHRLSQGILMPLFPTMYGQLTAIAREFNFPSTVGLCLYHHITENGITMTPRISDDAWQYLWAHLIESRNGSQQLPIGGRVEFDIDLNKARWFDAWLAGTLRDDTLVPAPQSHASILHLHGDSKTVFAEEPIANEDRWDNQTTQSNSRPTTLRHVPKKLSLVDRLDSTALQASYKASQATSPPPNHVVHQLSPIPQSAAPQTSKAELRRRVNSWRASAFLDPASMTESYQPVPNATLGAGVIEATEEYPLEGEAEGEVQEPLNLADFAWSVTSAGPLSPPLDSPSSSYRLPSIHLDRRMQESVLLTPTTATSWGPPDDDWLSDVSSIDRLPSPDLGRRMLESAPMTPATATSWGPADDWRSDVSSIDRLPSPDIAHRMMEDALASPVSGAPWNKVWPWFKVRNVSPAGKSYSPWTGMSASSSSWFDVRNVSPVGESYSPWAGISASSSSWFDVTKVATLPSTTSYNPWAGMPWVQVWPWFNIHASRDKGDPELQRSTSLNPWAGMPWFNVGPWHEVNGAQSNNSAVISLSRSGGLKPEYPINANFSIDPASYPYFDIYPACAERNSGLSSAGGYPIFEIYPAVYPHFNLYPSIACSTISSPKKTVVSQPQKSVIVELAPAYPLFNLYPPLYPYNLNSIYPAPTVELPSSVVLPSSYPWLTIYPSVYPHVNPYPQASAEVTRPRKAKVEIAQPVQVKLRAQYPVLDICMWNERYPWSLKTVYPPTKVEDASEITVRLASRYPWLDIYPSVYPFVEPYPTLNKTCESPMSRSQTKFKSECVKVTLARYYPSFDLYPPAYPHFDLYPRVQIHASRGGDEMTTSKFSASSSTYPFLVIYAPVYPHFELYPARAAEPASREEDITNSKLFTSNSAYPFLVICAFYVMFLARFLTEYVDPAVYPHFNLYPVRAAEPASREEDTLNGKSFVSAYPFLVVYPHVYPHFNLYPARAAELASLGEDKTSGKFSVSAYPFLHVDPHVYPHFNLYPARAAELASRGEDKTSGKFSVSAYPFLVVYPDVYPHFNLYPTRAAEVVTREESKILNVTAGSYPYLVIYPAVYPHFDIYPALGNVAQPSQKATNMPVHPLSAKRRRKTHAELHAEVAPSHELLVARRKPVKTHRQLHAEVFVNGVTWTPSGYVQDLALPDKPHEEPNRGPRRRMPSVHDGMPRLPRSRSVTLSNQQPPTNPSLRERQQHVLHNAPPIPPLRISSPGVPAVSEFPIPISPPASPTSRLSQAVRSFGSSIMHGRNLTSTPDDRNERAKSPTRSMFPSFDRRSSMIPSLPPHDSSDLLGRSRSPVQQGAQSLVLQRARAYEQSTGMLFFSTFAWNQI
ncbi:hypothetical protein EDB19DRAFT_1956059 [Suillus lakei]|nr:hypothetical protein EDB19DRAFT_1956059 [Suillus lakei]